MNSLLASSRRSRDSDTSIKSDDINPELFTLVEKRKWRKVRRLLKSLKGKRLCKEFDKTGLSCLGVALGFQAPLGVIKLMISIAPFLVDYQDSYGAGCLHVACLNGAALDSIDYLLIKYPHLVNMTDNDGRVPLHHAVEFACQCQDEEDEDFCLDMIELLYQARTETIHCSDKSGDSPLDLLQMFKTSSDPSTYRRLDEIYRLVRSFSIQEYKKNKQTWEDEGYDTAKCLSPKHNDGPSVRSKATTNTSTSTNDSQWSIVKGSTVQAEVGENGEQI